MKLRWMYISIVIGTISVVLSAVFAQEIKHTYSRCVSVGACDTDPCNGPLSNASDCFTCSSIRVDYRCEGAWAWVDCYSEVVPATAWPLDCGIRRTGMCALQAGAFVCVTEDLLLGDAQEQLVTTLGTSGCVF